MINWVIQFGKILIGCASVLKTNSSSDSRSSGENVKNRYFIATNVREKNAIEETRAIIINGLSAKKKDSCRLLCCGGICKDKSRELSAPNRKRKGLNVAT